MDVCVWWFLGVVVIICGMEVVDGNLVFVGLGFVGGEIMLFECNGFGVGFGLDLYWLKRLD